MGAYEQLVAAQRKRASYTELGSIEWTGKSFSYAAQYMERSVLCDEAISFFAAVKVEIASSLRSSQ